MDDAPPLRLAPAAVPEADDEPEVVGDAEPAEMVEDAEPDEDGSPEYFVAAYPPGSTLRHPKTFRLYPYGRELLVLYAGPFCWALVGTLTDRPGVRETIRRDEMGSARAARGPTPT